MPETSLYPAVKRFLARWCMNTPYTDRRSGWPMAHGITHDFAAEGVSDVVLRRYPRRLVEALADGRFALARRLRDLMAASLRTAHSHLMLLGRKSASERIASFLLEMAERLPGHGDRVVCLPMTRTDVADYLGMTIETVCRNLAQF